MLLFISSSFFDHFLLYEEKFPLHFEFVSLRIWIESVRILFGCTFNITESRLSTFGLLFVHIQKCSYHRRSVCIYGASCMFSNRLDKVNCKLISSFRSFQSNALLVAHSWKIWIGTVVIRGWGNALRLEKNVSRIRPWRREFERLLEYEWGILEMFSKLSDTNHTTLQWIVRFTAFESRMKCIRRLSTGHIINIVHSGVFFLFIARLHVYTSNRISVPFNRKSQALFQTETPMQRKNANGKSFGWCNVFFLARSFIRISLAGLKVSGLSCKHTCYQLWLHIMEIELTLCATQNYYWTVEKWCPPTKWSQPLFYLNH